MPQDTLNDNEKISRRDLLKRAGLGGAALLGSSLLASTPRPARASSHRGSHSKPNILFVIVDQQRTPRWFPDQAALDIRLPAQARLRRDSVVFQRHYTAASACTPSRSAILSGLYSHQVGMFNTQASDLEPSLNPKFPTWGVALRSLGYRTNWYGKWHLSHENTLEPYGFDGGTFPSPNGGPQQGVAVDGSTVDQFLGWLGDHGDQGPWATAVSLINPHDIMWYPNYTADYAKANPPEPVFSALPPNFETPDDLRRRGKPDLQFALQNWANNLFGALPYSGDGTVEAWAGMLNQYLAFHEVVDQQIGRVLAALNARPALAANTIVIFTADHGEYAGSHGLRGKALAAYEESTNVPLMVFDPTGRWTQATEVDRHQLTSTVDLYGLLLTLANGGNDWRGLPQFQHLAHRLDVAGILSNPNAPGRPYVLHTSDEAWADEFFDSTLPASVPSHVIGYRTRRAKLVTYDHWTPGTLQEESGGRQLELYDYETPGGRKELDNDAVSKPGLRTSLTDALTSDAIPNELRRPLPRNLQEAQQEAFQDYLAYIATQKGQAS